MLLPIASSQAKEYHLSEYYSTIQVQTDGSLKVAETLNFTFTQGNFSYAYRDIPWKGFEEIKDISVLSQSGSSLGYSLSFAGGNYHIQWDYPQAQSPTSRTFTVQYTVTNALVQPTAFQNRLDWQPVGPGWQVPIQNVRVNVTLPGQWNSSVLAYSPTPSVLSQSLGRTDLVFTYPELAPFNYYRVIVDFPKVVNVALGPIRIIRDSPYTVTLLTFLLLTLGMIVLWVVRGRNPRVESELASSYASLTPPSTLTPEEVNCLLKQSTDVKGIMAALSNLGKKGYIIIHGVAYRKEEYALTNRDIDIDPLAPLFEVTSKGKEVLDPQQTSELPDHERTMLKGVSEYPFSLSGVIQVENKFNSQMYDSLARAGLIEASPRHVRVRFALAGLTTGSAAFLFLAAGINYPPLFSFVGIFGGFVLGALPIAIVGYFMPRLTRAGAVEKTKWVNFLIHVKDRVDGLRQISPREAVDTLDRYVEFAPIIPRSRLDYWMKKLSTDLEGVQYAPEWYISPVYYDGSSEVSGASVAPFNVTSALSNDFAVFATSLASSFSHYDAIMAPAGGGAGGGSGGGGGGGGGGGAG